MADEARPPGTNSATAGPPPRGQNSWHGIRSALAGESARLRRALADPRAAQTEFLQGLVEANARTDFGLEHDFAQIRSHEEFAHRVPVRSYEGFAPYIDRVIAGDANVLTHDPVLFVELTGGSTGGSKVIPFTRGALDGYAAALRPWLADLVERWPEIACGRVYFALSPVGRTGGERIGAVPIGNADQFDYFGDIATHLAELSIVPSALAGLSDVARWQFATCLHLLAARDLSLVWVWSPTYLLELLQAVMRMRDQLLGGLAQGGAIGVPTPQANPSRAAELQGYISHSSIDTASIWPNLRVISCWMDASSASFVPELRRFFPDIAFQAKGLMATEGATTVPFGEGPGAPIAVRSGFFEFANDDGIIRPAWELGSGDVRRLILSNHSGLYRYDTGDLVEVVGFEDATPRLRFLGRVGLASDLCGEKLTDHFVLDCLAKTLEPGGGYAFLAAATDPSPHYQLWLDGSQDTASPAVLAAAVDEALKQNPQYEYARRLGQLQPVAARSADLLYERYCGWALSRGRELGHLKPPALLGTLPPDLLASLRAD